MRVIRIMYALLIETVRGPSLCVLPNLGEGFSSDTNGMFEVPPATFASTRQYQETVLEVEVPEDYDDELYVADFVFTTLSFNFNKR